MHVGEGLYALEGCAGADGERVQLGSVLSGKMESTFQISHAHTVISYAISKVESVRKYPEYDCRLLEPWVTTLPVSSSPALPKGSGLWPILFLTILRASQASECNKTALYVL